MKPKAKRKRAPAGLQRQSSKRVIGRPFQPGQSGNPTGRRKGSVSPTAALRRALTRADADTIAQKLIRLAKGGDPAALKILLDRCDGPLNGPLAIISATAQAASVALPPAGRVEVVIADNGRENYLRRASTEELLAPAPAPDPEPPSIIEPEDSEPPPPVMSGSDFLREG